MKTKEKAVELRELIQCCADCLESAGTMATEYTDWITEAGELEKQCREYLRSSPASKWISVEDRLPEVSGAYLVSANKAVWEATYFAYFASRGKWHDLNAPFDGWTPTHWQPLPPPPELMTKGKL